MKLNSKYFGYLLEYPILVFSFYNYMFQSFQIEVVHSSHGSHSNCPQLHPIAMGTVMPCHSSPGLDPADPKQCVHSRQLGVPAGNPLSNSRSLLSSPLLFSHPQKQFLHLTAGGGCTHHLERLSLFSLLCAHPLVLSKLYHIYAI